MILKADVSVVTKRKEKTNRFLFETKIEFSMNFNYINLSIPDIHTRLRKRFIF
jgi:hypothetical protein